MLIRYATAYATKHHVSCQNFLDACERELLQRGLLMQESELEKILR